MKKLLRPMLLSLLAAIVLIPTLVAAQQVQSEIITGQVNITTPAGTNLIGTVVARRSIGATVSTDWSFNGMVNGSPAQAAGTAVELWGGNGSETVEVSSITTWQMPIPQPPLTTLQVVQSNPGMLTIAGVPVAINGTLEAPGSGNKQLVLATPGMGSKPINQLPNTAGRLAADPFAVAGLLTVAGLVLFLSSRLLRAPRAGRSTERQVGA